jgi:Cytochrome c3
MNRKKIKITACLILILVLPGSIRQVCVEETARAARPAIPKKSAEPDPIKKTNCVRCHLTAGRELTAPVRYFARSVHDLANLSCNDCHGGNTKDDGTAHAAEHGFIGTKLSAHIAKCAGCHERQAETFRKGKHYRDLSKGIDRKAPVCIDCHGNHDIGKPPADFTLTNVCTDCHKKFAAEMPQVAAVVAENDRLWQILRKVHAKNSKADDPTPQAHRRDLDQVRSMTSKLIHRAGPVTEAEAQDVNNRARRLREALETWLKERHD